MKIFYQGGLGNQLFQYSFGKYLAFQGYPIEFQSTLLNIKHPKLTPRKYELDALDEPVDSSKVDANIIGLLRILPFLNNRAIIEKEPSQKIEKMISYKTKYIIGYFQSLEYIESIWHREQEKFTFFLNRPKYLPKNYTAIHLRFGDYRNTENRKIFGTLSQRYFARVLKNINKEKSIEALYVVTDSYIDTKNFLSNLNLSRFDVHIKSTSILEDFNILIHSNNNIISNSSFSWWSAYLGSKFFNSRIHAPTPWYVNGWKTHDKFYLNQWELYDRSTE